jgi:hypothetical protein
MIFGVLKSVIETLPRLLMLVSIIGLSACEDKNTIKSKYNKGKPHNIIHKHGGGKIKTQADLNSFIQEGETVTANCYKDAFAQVPINAVNYQIVNPTYTPVQSYCTDYGVGGFSNVVCNTTGGYVPGVTTTVDTNMNARKAYYSACIVNSGWFEYQVPPCEKNFIPTKRFWENMATPQELNAAGFCYTPDENSSGLFVQTTK